MPGSRDIARLEARIDRLYEAVADLRDRLDTHIGNHHSRSSTIKQGSAIGATLSVLYLLSELVRRLITGGWPF